MDYEKYISVVNGFPKAGISFKDISPLTARPEMPFISVSMISPNWRNLIIRPLILGPESRGFIFGAALAYKMGIGFVMARKAGKLPGMTASVSYTLEYGTASAWKFRSMRLSQAIASCLIDDLDRDRRQPQSDGRSDQKSLGADPVAALVVIYLRELQGEKALDIPLPFASQLSAVQVEALTPSKEKTMEKIIVLDFGGQYNQLIARRVRQCHVYSEVFLFTTPFVLWRSRSKALFSLGGPIRSMMPPSPHVDPRFLLWASRFSAFAMEPNSWLTNLAAKSSQRPHSEYGKTEITLQKPFSFIGKTSINHQCLHVAQRSGDALAPRLLRAPLRARVAPMPLLKTHPRIFTRPSSIPKSSIAKKGRRCSRTSSIGSAR
jgi:adenine phosphoribosyltransferase